jgi:MarR family
MTDPSQRGAPTRTTWTFVTNHFNVLLCIARDPSIRLRDVAAVTGITERATQAIVADLVAAGYLTRSRVGRRNRYDVHLDLPLRHPVDPERTIGNLIDPLVSSRSHPVAAVGD